MSGIIRGLLGCLVLVLANPSVGHEMTPATVDITINENKVVDVKILHSLESMIAQLGFEHEDTTDTEGIKKYQELRALSSEELRTEFEKFVDKFSQEISVKNEAGVALKFKALSVNIPSIGDVKLPRESVIEMRFVIDTDDVSLSWQWPKIYGDAIVRAASYTGELNYAALLAPGQKSGAIPLGDASINSSPSRVAINYIVVGFKHILPMGLDHVLFIVALFLLSPYWKPLLIQVTTFTVAHSITLFLGTMNLISVPANIVEPMIALSIVLLCVENIFYSTLYKSRVFLVFLFGLLHGLGFAGVLGEVGLDVTHFFIALLSFNVGVELGQLVVIIICMLVVGLWFRRKQWYHARISVPASLIIGLIGGYWFFDRISFSLT